MSIKVMSWIWEHSAASGSELLVLLAMADFADDKGGNIYPSMQTLAKKARMSPDQARRVVHKLMADGRVELVQKGGWDGGRNRSNEYRLVLDGTCNLQVPRTGKLQGPSADASTGTRADASTVLAPMQEDPSYIRPLEPSGEKSLPPFDFNRGLPAPRQAKRDADHAAAQRNKLGLSAKELTALTDAILDRNGKRAVADLETDMGEAELRYARECALSLAAMGHKTPDAIDVLFATWRTHDWRGQKGELPDYRQLVTHAAALPGKVKAAPTLSKEERERQVGRAKLALSTIRTDEKLGHKPSPRDLKIVEDARALGII